MDQAVTLRGAGVGAGSAPRVAAPAAAPVPAVVRAAGRGRAGRARVAVMSASGSWVVVGAVTVAGVLFLVAAASANRLLSPRAPTPEKLTTYESGVDPVGSGFSQSQVRYYIFALLFVMFDVEAVFIFPWALGLESYGVFGLVEMFVFLVILLLGLLYAWRKGVLRWV